MIVEYSIMDYSNYFKIYSFISKERCKIGNYFFFPFEYIVRKIYLKWFFPTFYRNERNKSVKEFENTIVSLTSFPARVDYIWLCIESLKHQEYRPEKIILYLSKEQFDKVNIPQSLKEEEDDYFEIRFVDGDLRSHKKYYYAMNEYPGKNIITADDDVIYPPNMLTLLYNCHKMFPNAVIANHTHLIKIKNGEVAPYQEWTNIKQKDLRKDFCDLENQIQIGVGGVLYPPGSLYKDVLNKDIAIRLSYLADDLWLYAMIKINKRKVIRTSFKTSSLIHIDIKNNQTLTSENVGSNKNDVQLKNIRNYYIEKLGIDIII